MTNDIFGWIFVFVLCCVMCFNCEYKATWTYDGAPHKLVLNPEK